MKQFITISLAFLGIALLGACRKDVINVLPIDQIPVSAAFQNMNDINNAVNGVYGSWQARRSHYVSALISDEVRLGTGTEYRNVGNILFNWQHVSDSQDWRDGETGGIWTNLYFVIDRANRVLELMIPVPATTSADVALKTRYRGEMLAIRGMAHLELLRNFARTAQYTPGDTGIVIQREYIKPDMIASYKPRRSTQAQVIAFIDSTLSEARALIPTTFTDISRITRNAVIASQARTALHAGNWQKVIDSATAVINAVPITNRANFPLIWTSRICPSNLEVIWKLNVTAANIGNAVGSLWQDVNGAVQASPATKLLNTYDQLNDIRYNTYFRTPTTTPPATRNLIAKYGVVLAPNVPAENFEYDIKMIRTSELILARAEAYAELNNLTAANTDLALVRANRINGYVHVAITDKQTLIDAIILERYKELCYEGQRYYDLRRRGLTINRDLADVVNNLLIQSLPPSNSKYILPIPQQEVFANPNVGQNPGY
jgi:hypothetical protein